MANEEALISGIDHKVRKLIQNSQELKDENSELHQHIDALEDKIKVLSEELELKRNELLKITLANTLEADYGVEETKERIDNLISELDKCIEVLSD